MREPINIPKEQIIQQTQRTAKNDNGPLTKGLNPNFMACLTETCFINPLFLKILKKMLQIYLNNKKIKNRSVMLYYLIFTSQKAFPRDGTMHFATLAIGECQKHTPSRIINSAAPYKLML